MFNNYIRLQYKVPYPEISQGEAVLTSLLIKRDSNLQSMKREIKVC